MELRPQTSQAVGSIERVNFAELQGFPDISSGKSKDHECMKFHIRLAFKMFWPGRGGRVWRDIGFIEK
jgi:hypothetical protein